VTEIDQIEASKQGLAPSQRDRHDGEMVPVDQPCSRVLVDRSHPTAQMIISLGCDLGDAI